MGLREFTNWDIRSDLEDVEPLKKYVFLCEGSNTEVAYFKHLMDIRKKLNVNPLIDYSILERTGLDATVSAPIRLVKYGIQYKNEDNFDSDRDTLIIVFDADFFENKKNEYKKILRKGREQGFIFGVTNPCFEIFLLLHYDGGANKYIIPRVKEFFPRSRSNKDLACRILGDVSGMNSKSNPKIGVLAESVKVAIREEGYLNKNIDICQGSLTSNVGQIIEGILNERIG